MRWSGAESSGIDLMAGGEPQPQSHAVASAATSKLYVAAAPENPQSGRL